MIGNGFSHRLSRLLAVCALICFLLSLLLPSVRVIVMGAVVALRGWEAMIWTIDLGCEALAEMAASRNSPSVDFDLLAGNLLAVITGVSNIVLLVGPVLNLRSSPRRTVTVGLLAISALGFMLGPVAALVEIESAHSTLLAGYFVWILAYVLLVGSQLAALAPFGAGNRVPD